MTIAGFRRTGRFVAVGVLGGLCSLGCDTISSGLPTGLTLYTNPGDPLILSNVSPSGEGIEVFGDRDADGIPTKLTSARYQSPDQVGTEDATWFMFDDSGRITALVGADGTVIEFEWTSSSVAVLSAVTGDGEQQVNTQVDFADPPDATARRRHADSASAEEPGVDRIGLPTQLEVIHHDPLPLPFAAAKPNAFAVSDRCAVRVQLRACDFPVENTANVGVVYVTVARAGNVFKETYAASRTGNPGEFVACLPVINQGPGVAATAMCNAIVGISGVSCDILDFVPATASDELLCTILAGAADLATFGPTGEGPALFGGCEAFVKGLRLFCATIGDVPGPPGPPSPLDLAEEATSFCETIGQELDRSSPTSDAQFVIEAVASGSGKFKATSGPQTVNANGPFPDLTVDFGGSFSIDSFTINPSAPAPGQSYVVRVRFSCVAGQKVTISVTGTDGFTSSTSKNLTGINTTMSLTVPGGADTVMDTIKVQVELAPGDVRQFRSTVIEF